MIIMQIADNNTPSIVLAGIRKTEEWTWNF
jgi:hypothetical protein